MPIHPKKFIIGTSIFAAALLAAQQTPTLPKALPVSQQAKAVLVNEDAGAGLNTKPEISAQEFADKKSSYQERLKSQKLSKTILLSMPNPRGQILAEYFDQNGKRVYATLANSKNGRYFQIDFAPIIKETNPVKIYAFSKAQVDWINEQLQRSETLSEYEVLTYFEHRRWIPLRVGSLLSDEDLKKLKNRALPEGLSYLDLPLRNYPKGPVAGHVIGAVKRSKGWPLRAFSEGDELYPPIEGIKGLEKSQNTALQGLPTVYKYEFDDNGLLKQAPQIVSPGRAGLDIVLSMDLNMQVLAENLLKKFTAKSGTGKGAMVVIDTTTMQIKALASWPRIDPNDFVPVLTSEIENKWNSDPNNPRLARAYQAAYPPASTFKLATGLMALSSELVEGNEQRYRCFDSITYHENNMKNWTQETGEPYMTVADALKRSCNTWFFQAANEMQSRGQAFEKWFHHLMPMLGLGKKTGLEISEEISGYAYVKDGKPESFYEGAHVANISIGQGDLATTPLQVAQMVARIANPEQSNMATLIRGRQDDSGKWSPVAFSVDESVKLSQYAEPLAWVRKGMWDVVFGNFGTGPMAKARRFPVVGKTGTAQWSQKRNVAWFASYAPFYDGSQNYPLPAKYAVVVMQEGNPGQELSGGNHAAPVVGEFFDSGYVQARLMDHADAYFGVQTNQGPIFRAVPAEQ